MDDLRILPVTNEELILNVATMAEEIWHEYFPALISEEQIDYMLEKFLSFDSIFEQIQNGYEYFLLIHDYTFGGFAGVHEENGSLFLQQTLHSQRFSYTGQAYFFPAPLRPIMPKISPSWIARLI